MGNWFKFILIILFAWTFRLIVTLSLGTVLSIKYGIPFSEITLGLWGDLYLSRIFVSIVGTFVGGFIIGTYLEKKAL